MRYVYIDHFLILIPKLVFLRLHELGGISFDFSFAPNLPNSLQVYCADVGYLVDGTDLACAGNNFAKAWHVGMSGMTVISIKSSADLQCSTPASLGCRSRQHLRQRRPLWELHQQLGFRIWQIETETIHFLRLGYVRARDTTILLVTSKLLWVISS